MTLHIESYYFIIIPTFLIVIRHPVKSFKKENFYVVSSFPTKPQLRKRMEVLWLECTKLADMPGLN